jgi:adenosylcobyric acid synthase
VPTLGVMPWLEHDLPDEDGAAPPRPAPGKPRVAVIRYPTASNLDELKPLEQVADVRFAARAEDLEGAALVILPGSKHVSADLAWLRRSGLADAVAARAGRGDAVLGICGGLQMLGARIVDEAGVDGSGEGLCLLPLVTSFRAEKAARRTRTRFCVLPQPWTALGGRPVAGYEIRHGETTAIAPVVEALPDGLGYVAGPVFGIYLHGLFEQPELVAALFSALPPRSLEQVFDRLADAVEEHLDLVPPLRRVGLA